MKIIYTLTVTTESECPKQELIKGLADKFFNTVDGDIVIDGCKIRIVDVSLTTNTSGEKYKYEISDDSTVG